MLSPRLGLSDSADALSLTGRGNDTVTLKLGIDDMDTGNDDGKWRYQIEVEGTGIREYYEYDERVGTQTVGRDWLADVEDELSESVARELAEHLKVIPLWQESQSQSSEDSGPIALGPPALEEE